MSKVPKDQIKEQKLKIKRRSDDKFAYRTVIISCILGIIFYIISFLFNIGIISIFANGNILFSILDVLIKITTILLFFLFMMVSIGNFKELAGKPLSCNARISYFNAHIQKRQCLAFWLFDFHSKFTPRWIWLKTLSIVSDASNHLSDLRLSRVTQVTHRRNDGIIIIILYKGDKGS